MCSPSQIHETPLVDERRAVKRARERHEDDPSQNNDVSRPLSSSSSSSDDDDVVAPIKPTTTADASSHNTKHEELQRWLRGSWYMASTDGAPSTSTQQHHTEIPMQPWKLLQQVSSSSSSQQHPPTTVNHQRWNAYWSTFSEKWGSSIDALTQEFSTDGVRRYRTVLVMLPSRPNTSSSSSSSNTEEAWKWVEEHFDDAVMSCARHFGSVVRLRYERRIVSVEFSVPTAAGLFVMWCDELPMHMLRNDGGSAHMKMMMEEEDHVFPPVRARLAPTASTRTSSRLLLGPHVVLSTAYADGLFKGLFEAREISFERASSSFVVSFDGPTSAVLALHALQASLWEVFGLSLILID